MCCCDSIGCHGETLVQLGLEPFQALVELNGISVVLLVELFEQLIDSSRLLLAERLLSTRLQQTLRTAGELLADGLQ